MNNISISDAIEKVKSGDLITANNILDQILKDNPNDVKALLWKTETTTDIGERRIVLNKILEIEPANEAAKKGLSVLPTFEDEMPSWIIQQPIEQPTSLEKKHFTGNNDEIIKIKQKKIKIEGELKDWNRTLNEFGSNWVGITLGVSGLVLMIFGSLIFGIILFIFGIFLLLGHRNKRAIIIGQIKNLEIQERKLKGELMKLEDK
jgi:hypothetical protein